MREEIKELRILKDCLYLDGYSGQARLLGECIDSLESQLATPNEFEIVIWQDEIFDNPQNSSLIVEGQLIDGVRINAIGTDMLGIMVSITANLDDFEFITGEWQVIVVEDDSQDEDESEAEEVGDEPVECRGYLSGQRI